MAIHEKEEHTPSAPTDASIFYPEEDGEPMAELASARAENAEAEVARLQEELTRLQARSN